MTVNHICIVQENRYFHSVLTKYKLTKSFYDRNTVVITDSSGIRHMGKMSSIQLEDGSGSSFNITTECDQKFHIRTID